MRKKWYEMRKTITKASMCLAVMFACTLFVNEKECKANIDSAVLEIETEDANIDSASLSYEWTVKVDKGYLALRTKKSYDASNEIGELYTGDSVDVLDSADPEYWYVYAPGLDKSGYVNKKYLSYRGDSSNAYSWSVKVDKNYLALRKEKAYDAKNEIGKLYTGDVVTVKKCNDSKYWYVYSATLDKFGYVNKDYLQYNAGKNVKTKTVSVDKGYLALRTKKAYDAKNEIGELYTGDEVEVIHSEDEKYWYVYAPSLNKVGYVNKTYLH